MLIGFLQFYLIFRKIVNFTVHSDPVITFLTNALQQFFMLALLLTHRRRDDDHFCALGVGEHRVGNLVHGLAADLPAADRTVRNSDSGIHQPEIVICLCHRSYD